MVDPSQLQSFMPFISGAIGGAASAGVFKGPIKTLEDWWYLNYGRETSHQANLLRAMEEASIEKLKADILNGVIEIPVEDIQNPKIKIIGPALEASKYYIEEEELRQMFAKVITSSLNSKRNPLIHSSFVEIIKQMDVLDAKILNYLKSLNVAPNYPIPTLQQVINIDDKELIQYPIIFFTDDLHEVYKNSASLINLNRLGLIDVNYSIKTLNDVDYYFLENHDLTDFLKKSPNTGFKRTSICLTTFGYNFLMCCV